MWEGVNISICDLFLVTAWLAYQTLGTCLNWMLFPDFLWKEEWDPSQVAHTSQVQWTVSFLAVGPIIFQLNMDRLCLQLSLNFYK